MENISFCLFGLILILLYSIIVLSCMKKKNFKIMFRFGCYFHEINRDHIHLFAVVDDGIRLSFRFVWLWHSIYIISNIWCWQHREETSFIIIHSIRQKWFWPINQKTTMVIIFFLIEIDVGCCCWYSYLSVCLKAINFLFVVRGSYCCIIKTNKNLLSLLLFQLFTIYTKRFSGL